MNERIKKLAEQHFVRIEFERGGVHECYEFSMEELEQFAELIVRECGVALSPMLRDMVSRGQAYDLIRKHFGVEE